MNVASISSTTTSNTTWKCCLITFSITTGTCFNCIAQLWTIGWTNVMWITLKSWKRKSFQMRYFSRYELTFIESNTAKKNNSNNDDWFHFQTFCALLCLSNLRKTNTQMYSKMGCVLSYIYFSRRRERKQTRESERWNLSIFLSFWKIRSRVYIYKGHPVHEYKSLVLSIKRWRTRKEKNDVDESNKEEKKASSSFDDVNSTIDRFVSIIFLSASVWLE